jgi:hypothetical protein
MKKIQHAAAQSAGKICVAMAIALSAPAYAQTDGSSIQPQAEKLLRNMSDFLGKQQSFSVTTENSLEVVLTSGQKIQYTSPASLQLKRPNLLRASRKGDLVDQDFYYDGKTLTLFSPGNGFYATTAAPATIDQTLDMARETLDVIAPGGDFIYTNSYAMLTQDVASGFYVGKAVVGGVTCDHLAFRGKDVDWQIWIAEGNKPLPKKYVITSKRVPGEPQFTVYINGWNLAPRLSNTSFSFKPPKNATRIDFLRMTTDAESATR